MRGIRALRRLFPVCRHAQMGYRLSSYGLVQNPRICVTLVGFRGKSLRKIFVASSTQALDKAEHVRTVITGCEGVDARLWTEFFKPGDLTFESLENMLSQCCAAVFIASPDDACIVGDRTIRSPRSNVLLEFGLVAGRLGRHSCAVCQYDGAELPSDLSGLTVIRMDEGVGSPEFGGAFGNHEPDPGLLRKEAEERLRVWTSRLLTTTEGVPRTDIVHGYSGRWDFEITLETWRDLRVVAPGFVSVRGFLDILLAASGQSGRGLAHARLQFMVPSGTCNGAFYQGEYRTAHEVVEVACETDGSLELTTTAFALEAMVKPTGTPPPELVGMDIQPEPWSARWTLCPGAGLHRLTGRVKSEGNIHTEGAVTATKLPNSL